MFVTLLSTPAMADQPYMQGALRALQMARASLETAATGQGRPSGESDSVGRWGHQTGEGGGGSGEVRAANAGQVFCPVGT